MGGKRKCRICGEWIEPSEEYVPYASGSVRGFAHQTCFDKEMKQLLTSKKKKSVKSSKKASDKAAKELKDGLSDEEYKEKQKLCDYIRQLINDDLSPKIYTLIEYYKKKFSVSYAEIRDTLYWYYELKENPVEGDAIGIFPYEYTNAMQYLHSIEQTEKHNEQIHNVSNLYPVKTIRISPTPIPQKKMIDIENIGIEDGERS